VSGSRPDVTLLLERVRDGDEGARDELFARVYDELRRVAARQMRRERRDHTLAATGLVHEAVVRLLEGGVLESVPDRSYLFAAAARAMRQVLVDHARRRSAGRRGGHSRRRPLGDAVDSIQAQGLDVLAVHEALEQLDELHPRQAQVVTLRYFGGLSVPEIAAALAISVSTVESDWRVARAWLSGRLRGDDGP
jgi:RNA polymerase sigma factor (TIGR02999 family)